MGSIFCGSLLGRRDFCAEPRQILNSVHILDDMQSKSVTCRMTKRVQTSTRRTPKGTLWTPFTAMKAPTSTCGRQKDTPSSFRSPCGYMFYGFPPVGWQTLHIFEDFAYFTRNHFERMACLWKVFPSTCPLIHEHILLFVYGPSFRNS